MRILITNDDGINAPGLEAMAEIAADLAGPDGEVWTVAPAFEQSGVAHCISYTHPMMISKMGERRYAAEGSPADCVLAGLHEVMEERPDLILSGVNRGNNSAENALYSGTLGGAMEGALQGVTSFALSQYLGPANYHADDPFEAARAFGAETIRKVLAAADGAKESDYRLFYNVNFPPQPADQVLGIRAAAQGFRRHTNFSTEPHHAPSGRKFLWIRGGEQHRPTAQGTDAAFNLEGFISVTPMRADLTAHDALATLKAIET